MRIETTESNHINAGKFAWFAERDASLKSAVNASLFSDFQKLKAERIKLVLELLYSTEKVSITNCKKWIRVKVHNGIVRDRKQLRILESDWAADGIKKHMTGQAIIYRVA